MARPAKPDARTAHVTFRVTREEKFRLLDKANRSGMNPGDYCRARVLAARARRQRELASDSLPARIDIELFHELRRIGVNINQIARHCHTHQVPAPKELNGALKELRAVLARVIAAS